MKKIDYCPACSATYEIQSQTIDIINTVKRIKCNICGTIFFEHDMQKASIYDAQYNSHFLRYGDLRKAVYYARVIECSAIALSRSRSILEIGPGSGLILLILKEKGYNIEGVEKDITTAAMLKKATGVRVYSDGLESLHEDLKWDIVFSSHVIEHWTNPREFLICAKKHMNENGLMIINTPCADYAQQYPHAWHHCNTRQPFEHCSLMTSRAFKFCAAAAGLEIINMQKHDKFNSMDIWLTKKT